VTFSLENRMAKFLDVKGAAAAAPAAFVYGDYGEICQRTTAVAVDLTCCLVALSMLLFNCCSFCLCAALLR